MKKSITALLPAMVVNVLALLALSYTGTLRAHHAYPMHHTQGIKVQLAQGQPKQTHANPTLVKWMKQHYGQKIKVIQHFHAGKNLEGDVIALKSNPQHQGIIYTLNQGAYYLMGTVIDQNGHNISLSSAQHRLQHPRNQAIFKALEAMPGILQGDPKCPTATILIDPNSPLFPQVWEAVDYDTAHNRFAIKWILLNDLKPSGPNTAAAILQSTHPIDALRLNARHYQTESQQGGYSPKKPIQMQSQTQKKLQDHANLVAQYHLNPLPITVLKSHQHVEVIEGAVMDETLEALLPDPTAGAND